MHIIKGPMTDLGRMFPLGERGKMKYIFGISAVCFGILTLGGVASAATSLCDATTASKLTINSGCELGSADNDNPLPGQVNSDEFFGYDNWEYLAKDEDLAIASVDDGTNPINFAIGVGSWSVSGDAYNVYDQLMIVLKGPNGDDTSSGLKWLISAVAWRVTRIVTISRVVFGAIIQLGASRGILIPIAPTVISFCARLWVRIWVRIWVTLFVFTCIRWSGKAGK